MNDNHMSGASWYKPLPIGISDFKKLIGSGYYYIDKTLFIKELIDKKSEVNLFTRPRRFGKSLCLSMIRYFFEKSENNCENPFLGLNIMDAGIKYTSEMNKYPVVYISFKNIESDNFERSVKNLRDEIIREFERHSYVLDNDKINARKKARYINMMDEKTDDGELADGVRFLSECLEQYHSEKAIILLDEYDVPLENAYFNGFYDEMAGLIRRLFNTALKDNGSLCFAVLTGCLRVSKESIFTGFNNPNIFSIASNAYSEYFGFTEEEVARAFDFYGVKNKLKEARRWYNGYVFGSANVYNPWSILNFLFDSSENKDWYPSPYWANTSSNGIVRELAELARKETRDEIENLIQGGSITKPVYEDIVYGEIKRDTDYLWNFLFFTGYLKKTGEIIDDNKKYFTMEIPNVEILYIYETKIKEWFTDKINAIDMGDLYESIVTGDAQNFEDALSVLLADTISYFDSRESFYHGFLTGVLSRMDGYAVKSNRESGNGRGDIFLTPASMKKPAVIIEIKAADTYAGMEKSCVDALLQINENKYEFDLRQTGYNKIIKYGIAFYRKDCMIRLCDTTGT